LAQNHVLACRSDSAGPTWTKIGTVKQLDHGNKPLAAFLRNLQIDPTPEGQSSKFDKKKFGVKKFFNFFFLLSQQPHATISTTTAQDLLLAPSTHVKFKIATLRLNNYSRGVILLWELQNDGSFSFTG